MTDGEDTAQGNGKVRPDTGSNLDPVSDCQAAEPEPHCFHLLVADAAIPECYEVFQTWVTLCGRKLRARDLPSCMCPPDCQREITYCPECVWVVVERNADADAAHIVGQLEQLRELVARDG